MDTGEKPTQDVLAGADEVVLFDQWANRWIEPTDEQPTCQQFDPSRRADDGQLIPRYLEYTKAERAELEASNNGKAQE